MGEPVDLSVERAARADDNRNITVDQALRWALGDTVKGDPNGIPFRAVIIIQLRKEDGSFINVSYRANIGRLEELGLIEVHKTELIQRMNVS